MPDTREHDAVLPEDVALFGIGIPLCRMRLQRREQFIRPV